MIKLELRELPPCGTENCNGKLLPVEDVSKEGQVYFKGWFCTACATSWLFNAGRIVVLAVTGKI